MKIKHLFTSALLAAAVLALGSLQAQQYAPVAILTFDNSPLAPAGVGWSVAATATSNYTSDVVLTKADQVAFQLSFRADGAGTDNVTVTFKESVDGTTWSTTPAKTWVVAANGNTLVTLTTNFNVGALGYLRVASIANASSDRAITNITLKAVIKPALYP